METDYMEEKTYTITLADGTEISDLTMNGNNYISKKPISEEIFKDNLSIIIIDDGTETTTMENMDLVQVTHHIYESGLEEYWFVLRQFTLNELKFQKMESSLEYLAMMTNVDL